MQSSLNIDIADDRWSDMLKDGEALCQIAVQTAMDDVALVIPEPIKGRDIEINILFADDETVRELNREYRKKDKPTNVLSFAYLDTDAPIDENSPLFVLGDIILAFETVEHEAEDQQKTFTEHCTHLIVHGFLHLLGYDHMESDEAEIMEALETRVMQTLGYKSPYQPITDDLS